MYQQPKIALIGSGNIGGTLAHLAGLRNLGEIVLVDINEGTPQGKSLDLMQAFAADGLPANISGSNDYAAIAGAHVVIVTAGLPRKPGMSRDDLLKINGQIIKDVGAKIKQYAPQAFVIVITNPLDVMVTIMQQATSFAHNMVVGMAGILDTSRYKHFLAQALGVNAKDIQAFVLGGHGDSMVPMPRFTNIAGIPLQYFVTNQTVSQEQLEAINQRTKNGGGEIVNLLKTGSAFYAPASSALQIAESYLFDSKRLLPCAAYITNAYGITDMYVGVPVIIGKGGVEKIIELELNESEKSQFMTSVKGVQELNKACRELGLLN